MAPIFEKIRGYREIAWRNSSPECFFFSFASSLRAGVHRPWRASSRLFNSSELFRGFPVGLSVVGAGAFDNVPAELVSQAGGEACRKILRIARSKSRK